MGFQDYFPVWDKLTPLQQQQLAESTVSRSVKRGTVIQNGSIDCTGLLLVRQGAAPRLPSLRRGAGDHPLPPV